MKKLLGIVVLGLLIGGCATPGENTSGRLEGYQYTPVQNMGNGVYWIQGYDTEDALTGGKAHCSKVGGSFLMVEMMPHTQTERATLTFKCQS